MHVGMQSLGVNLEAVRLEVDPRGRKHAFEGQIRSRFGWGSDLGGQDGTFD